MRNFAILTLLLTAPLAPAQFNQVYDSASSSIGVLNRPACHSPLPDQISFAGENLNIPAGSPN